MQLLLLILTTATLVAAQDPPPPAERPTDVRPLVVGARLPSAVVDDERGDPHDLAALAGTGKVALVVYRGGWCPVCLRHFQALGTAVKELTDRGWTFIAVSPDSPETIAAWNAEHGEASGVTRYSDSDVDAIRALGLAYVLDDATLEQYAGYGIDVEKASGQQHHVLPVPALLLVVDGELRFLHADADYRRRLDPGVLMAAVAAIEGAASE